MEKYEEAAGDIAESLANAEGVYVANQRKGGGV